MVNSVPNPGRITLQVLIHLILKQLLEADTVTAPTLCREVTEQGGGFSTGSRPLI